MRQLRPSISRKNKLLAIATAELYRAVREAVTRAILQLMVIHLSS